MKKASIVIFLQLITSLNFIYAQSWDFVDTGILNSDSSYILSSLHTDEKILLGLGRITGWTYYIPGGLLISIDGGSSWDYKNLIDPIFGGETKPISSLLLIDSILFAGTPGGGIFKTTNWGDEWINSNNGIIGNAHIVYTLELLNESIYAGTGNGVYISTNLGETWVEHNSGLPISTVGYYPVTSILQISDTLYAGVLDGNQGEGGIYCSTDWGNNWSPFLTQIYFLGEYYNCDILAMKYFNSIFFIGETGFGIFKSFDLGYSWEHTDLFGDYGKFVFEETNMLALWGSIQFSRNNGETWEDIRYNLINMNYYKFNTAEIINNFIFVGTTSIGLWKFDLDQINSVDTKINFWDAFNLFQNYPNPFNPVTKIKYSIPEDVRGEKQEVILKIYDVLGREVATLVNEEQPAGEYEVEFDGSALTSGIYFYQLKAGEYSETRKMVLLR